MPDIAFNSIPLDTNTPGNYHEFDGSQAQQGLPSLPHKALIVAPRLSTGLVAAGVPFQINSPNAGELGFGRGSIGSLMAKAWKKNNKITELWGIGVADNGSGVPAAGVLTFSGTATASGVLHLYICGVYVPVTVTVGMTAAQLVLAVVAAIALTKYELPVTAADGTGDTVDLTAKNDGTQGNNIDVRINYREGEVTPAGITATVSTPMASGATDGDVAGAIAALGDEQYHTIVSAWDADAVLDLFEAELAERWLAMSAKEGHLYAAVKGSQGTMTSAGNARNHLNSTLFGTGLSPTPTYEAAAMVAAIDALQCSIDPSRPRTTLPIVGLLPPSKAAALTREERNILLSDGVSTYVFDNAGQCSIERIISTHQTSNGVPDTTYRDVPTVRLLAALRYSQTVWLALKFPRFKLADDAAEIPPGLPIAQPKTVKSSLIELYKVWMDAGWTENLDAFKAALTVQRNTTDVNRVDILLPPDIINQLLVTATSNQFRL